MDKQYCLTIDDCIRFFEESVGLNAASVFEAPFLGLLNELHSRYRCKIQLNMFWSYEPEGFSLADVPNRYRDELSKNAGWLKFSFHAAHNSPDFPYDGRTGELLRDFDSVTSELRRIAGRQAVASTTTIHYVTADKPASAALGERGIKALIGMFYDLPGRESLRYWLTREEARRFGACSFLSDNDTGLVLARNDMVLNRLELSEIVPLLERLSGTPNRDPFLQLMTHEQYFYRDYIRYQPDFKEKLEAALSWLTAHGYRSCFLEEALPD